MVTTIDKFKEAYATMTIAVYEPLILKWVSNLGLLFSANALAVRTSKKANQVKKAKISTHAYLMQLNDEKIDKEPQRLPQDDRKVKGMKLPHTVNKRLNFIDPDFDFKLTRNSIYKELLQASREALINKKDLTAQLKQALQVMHTSDVYHFIPFNIEEALSPIGIAHYYRQLYFNLDEGFGPIEQCFTVAPKETLIVNTVTEKKQIHEEMVEMGHEIISEQAFEEKNSTEVSDKVSSMLQRDTSIAMSASGSYNTGIVQVGAQTSMNLNFSKQKAKETATKKLKDVTKRASERITKTYSLKTRTYQEFTDTTENTRTIANTSERPVNYALRRIFNRIQVKVQDLGPKLVWQLYLRDPGRGLQTSQFVHFRNVNEMVPNDFIPPGFREKPKGGVEEGTASVVIEGNDPYFVNLSITTTKDRVIRRVQIDTISDLEESSKDDSAPAPLNQNYEGQWNEADHTYTARIQVKKGDADSVSIAYTYHYEPSQAELDKWNDERLAQINTINEEAAIKEFERKKTLIMEQSKIRPRPANELRREERYEVMNRMVSYLYSKKNHVSEPSPLEIEFFHRFFDIEAMFTVTHPSWWKPRTQNIKGAPKRAYPITKDSEPAKLGSSLGWEMQLDGDNRRNEFLNSPWIRVCLPMKAGREREAIDWLAEHVEGDIGFSMSQGPVKSLIESVEERRSQELDLGNGGQDYVTVDSTVGAPSSALTPENIYPIVDQFEVTVPTEGFVYDQVFLKDESTQREEEPVPESELVGSEVN